MVLDKKKVLLIIFFCFVIFMIFGVEMAHQLKHGDFPPHIAWAKEYSTNGYLYKIPHPLFAKFVTVVRALLPANVLVWISPYAKQVYDLKAYELSALIVTTLSYFSLGWILLKRIIKEWNIQRTGEFAFVIITVCTLLLFGPIFFFTFPERMFRGYLAANRYDSPTFILAKPFVLVAFFGIIDNLLRKWNWKESVIMMLVMICGTLAKPSFTVTILPTLGIWVLLELKNFKKINWAYLIFPIGITATIVLIGQFLINYVGDRGDRIIIAPFMEVLKHVPNIPFSFFLVLMSVLFPLLITVFYWKQVIYNLGFRIAWLNLAVGLVMYYLVAEEINMGVNNFWNGPMLGNFLLFVISVIWWGKDLLGSWRAKIKFSWKQYLTSGVLVLHLSCGIIYYFAILFNTMVNVD